MRLQENTLFSNRYQLERLLGRGGFSEVWLAKDNWTHLRIAIKVYAPGQGMDTNGLHEFCGELAKVFDLNHTNLLKPTHVDSWNDMPYLIMAYCSQGSITKYIGKMPEEQIWQLIHDVASGLAYLHKNDIVHQDIKPDNILIDDAGNFVITDFGISTKARSTLRKSVIGGSVSGGTFPYMAPERFSKQPAPTKASDIWSFGAMIYELIEGNVPFGETGGVFQKAGAEIPEITAPVSDKLKQLVCQMLSLDTWDRPTAEQLINGTPSKTPAQQVAPAPTSRPTVKWTSQPDQPQLTQQQEQKPHGLFAKMKESCKKRNLFVNIILYMLLGVSAFFVIILCLATIESINMHRDFEYLSTNAFWPVVFLQGAIVFWGVWRILNWKKDGISIMLLLCWASVFPWIFAIDMGMEEYINMLCAQYAGILLIWLVLLIRKNGISTWKQCKDFSLAGKIINGFCISAFVVSMLLPSIVAKSNGFNKHLLGYGTKCIDIYTCNPNDIYGGASNMIQITYAIAFGHDVKENKRINADKWFERLMNNDGLEDRKLKIGCDYLAYRLVVIKDKAAGMRLYDNLKNRWGEQAIIDYFKSGDNNYIPTTWKGAYISTHALRIFYYEDISSDIFQCKEEARHILFDL